MYKTLSVAVLLLAIFAFASGSKSVEALPATPTFPIIVAKGALTNQTEPFSATIYTPPTDGLFRLSAYATVTIASTNPPSEPNWIYTYSWTDASGQVQSAFPLYGAVDRNVGQFYVTFPQGGIVTTIQANKGTPIMQQMSGSPDGSAYAVYYTLERLE